MLKEIHEQPQVVAETFRGRIDFKHGKVHLDEVSLTDEDFENRPGLYCRLRHSLACRVSVKRHIERLARVPVEVDYGSEFRYRAPVINEKTLFVVISQSWETADTLGSLSMAAEAGAKTIAICNVVGSTIARKAGMFVHSRWSRD